MTRIILCNKPGKCCPEIVVKEDDGTIRKPNTNDIKILKQKLQNGEL